VKRVLSATAQRLRSANQPLLLPNVVLVCNVDKLSPTSYNIKKLERVLNLAKYLALSISEADTSSNRLNFDFRGWREDVMPTKLVLWLKWRIENAYDGSCNWRE
jgi:hypothetical protein